MEYPMPKLYTDLQTARSVRDSLPVHARVMMFIRQPISYIVATKQGVELITGEFAPLKPIDNSRQV